MRNSPHSSIEDVAELMQQIQVRLPIKEAARTSVLSKSWLHAWSTIPTLRFRVGGRKLAEVVERTLSRYLRDNIPVERFELDIVIRNVEFASLAEKWIRSVATETLKELSISVTLIGASLTLTDEMLSVGKSLKRLRICWDSRSTVYTFSMNRNSNRIINCVSLREVILIGVFPSQEVLDGIFSTCTLLENIVLDLHVREEPEHRTITIKNLAYLKNIDIYAGNGDSIDLEIRGVPNLRVFRCDLNFGWYERPGLRPFSAYSISLATSRVTDLELGGLITDESSLEMIMSAFPFLESLTLVLRSSTLEIFHFTCSSLKRLDLQWAHKLIDVKVYAPKLLYFLLHGYTLPSLSFPVSTLGQIKLDLTLRMPLDVSFFVRMREALTVSSKCDVAIKTEGQQPFDIDLDDLRRRLPFPPANNVNLLCFQTDGVLDDSRSPFLNAFFEICHPKHVRAYPDFVHEHRNNHFFELMLKVLEKKKMKKTSKDWPRYLKHAWIKHHNKWEAITSSHRGTSIWFKLNWR